MTTRAELAFVENLLLLSKIQAPTLMYVLKRGRASRQSLVEICVGLRLITAPAAEELMNKTRRALETAGSSSMSFSKGALVGPWEIQEPRGIGLGGAHYLCLHESTRQSALLRLIEPALDADTSRHQRLVARANAGAEPPHPAILKIDEVGEDFGWLYTATGRFDGWNLSSRLAQGPLKELEALHLLQTVAGALNIAHNLQVTHGGLSPLSLLMNPQGAIFITDFGVGSVVLDGPLRGQRPGGRLGNLLFAGPELITGDAEAGIDPRSDIYSLGAILYDSLLRLDCKPETNHNLPWQIAPPISEGFKLILARCLARKPQHRYASIAAMLADIERIQAGSPPGPLPPSPPVPPFRGLRDKGAIPQRPVEAAMLADSPSKSDSERRQAQEDFLASVAAAAPPPEVPEGYQEELFKSSEEAPLKAPPEAAPIDEDDEDDREEPIGGAIDDAHDAPEGTEKHDEHAEGNEEHDDGSGGVKTRIARRPKPRAPKPGKSVSRRSGRASAPARRSPAAAKASSGTAGAIIIVVLLISGLAGGAVFAGRQFELTPAEASRRARLRASYLSHPETRRYADAARVLEAAGALPLSPKQSAELRAARRQLERRAADDFRQARGELPADGAARLEALDTAAGAYAGTDAVLLVALDRAIAAEDSPPALIELGESLFRAGLSAAAVEAYDAALKATPGKPALEQARRRAELATAMVYVPAGEAVLGEERIKVEAYYLARTEVSRKEYQAFLESITDEAERARRIPKGWRQLASDEADLPVLGLKSDDARAYADWRGARLPTAAEHALAAGRDSRYPWGSEDPDFLRACHGAETFGGQVTPVGSLIDGASADGALDLAGNAAEWCVAPDTKLVLKGGSFNSKAEELDAHHPGVAPVGGLRPDAGLRLALDARIRS